MAEQPPSGAKRALGLIPKAIKKTGIYGKEVKVTFQGEEKVLSIDFFKNFNNPNCYSSKH